MAAIFGPGTTANAFRPDLKGPDAAAAPAIAFVKFGAFPARFVSLRNVKSCCELSDEEEKAEGAGEAEEEEAEGAEEAEEAKEAEARQQSATGLIAASLNASKPNLTGPDATAAPAMAC